jgi:hypothetical protein
MQDPAWFANLQRKLGMLELSRDISQARLCQTAGLTWETLPPEVRLLYRLDQVISAEAVVLQSALEVYSDQLGNDPPVMALSEEALFGRALPEPLPEPAEGYADADYWFNT